MFKNKDNKKKFLVQGSDKMKSVILFIPGISGGVFTDRFSLFYEKCNKNNIDIFKAQYWQDLEDLENKNIVDIFGEIDNTISYLKEKGYKEIFGVGKSFGGTMLLIRNHSEISKMVLWAPSIGVTKQKGNLAEKKTVLFSEIDSLLDIEISTDHLLKIRTPIKIINGKKDKISPLRSAKKITQHLKNGVLKEIPEAGHSYETIKIQKELVKETINFL